MTDQPTCRKMLATIATAAAAVPVAALPVLAGSPDEDAVLFAHEPRLLDAQAAVGVAIDVQGDADERHFGVRLPEPVLDADFGKTVEGDKVIWAKHSADLVREFPEIAYFGISTGRIIFEAGSRDFDGQDRTRKNVPTYPIVVNGEQVGYIIVDPDPNFLIGEFRHVRTGG